MWKFSFCLKLVPVRQGQRYVLLEGLRSNMPKLLLSCERLPSWNYRRVIKLGTGSPAPEMCVVIMSVTYVRVVMCRTLSDERNFLRDEWTQRRSVGTLSKCRRTGKVTRSDLLRVGKRVYCFIGNGEAITHGQRVLSFLMFSLCNSAPI